MIYTGLALFRFQSTMQTKQSSRVMYSVNICPQFPEITGWKQTVQYSAQQQAGATATSYAYCTSSEVRQTEFSTSTLSDIAYMSCKM